MNLINAAFKIKKKENKKKCIFCAFLKTKIIINFWKFFFSTKYK